MRIFPLVLIGIGVFELLRHFGFIDPALVHLLWPLLLIGIGLALLSRGPRWRSDMHHRMHGRWEPRMHRHFGPGWANLSEAERERFRAGMRQGSFPDAGGGTASPSPAASDGSFAKPAAPPPAPGEQR
jgi:hypothetical protein